jgi:hypothetical protein
MHKQTKEKPVVSCQFSVLSFIPQKDSKIRNASDRY